MSDENQEVRKPEDNLKLGAIQLALWKQTAKTGENAGNEFLTASIKKTYLPQGADAKNPKAWRVSNSFTKKDLENLKALIEQAIPKM